METERQKLESAKAEVESLQTGSFRMLLDGGWEDEEVRDACIDAVCSYLKDQGADAVLLAALPKALTRNLRIVEFSTRSPWMRPARSFRARSPSAPASSQRRRRSSKTSRPSTQVQLQCWIWHGRRSAQQS